MLTHLHSGEDGNEKPICPSNLVSSSVRTRMYGGQQYFPQFLVGLEFLAGVVLVRDVWHLDSVALT